MKKKAFLLILATIGSISSLRASDYISGVENRRTGEKIVLECVEENQVCENYNILLLDAKGEVVSTINQHPIAKDKVAEAKVKARDLRLDDTASLWRGKNKYELSNHIFDYAGYTSEKFGETNSGIILMGLFAPPLLVVMVPILAGQGIYLGLLYAGGGLAVAGQTVRNVVTMPIRSLKRAVDTMNVRRAMHKIQDKKFFKLNNRSFKALKTYMDNTLK